LKILFIYPPALNTINEFSNTKDTRVMEIESLGTYPPLGLLYVLSYYEHHNPHDELLFLDCVAEKLDFESLEERISIFKPDIVAITSFTISLIDIIKTSDIIRKIVPKSHICLGGHHATSFPKESLLINKFDSIVIGEGEISFNLLVQKIKEKKKLSNIAGVYTKEDINLFKGIYYSAKNFYADESNIRCAIIEDLNLLPFPNRKHIEHLRYYNPVGKSKKLATIISSRGCPYHCTFCDVPIKKHRQRSIINFVNEIETVYKQGYREFHFYDDLFNITEKRVIDIANEIIKRNLKIKWDFRGRINSVTKESLIKLKDSGCWLISFGVETGSDKGLIYLKKGINLKQIKKVFDWCKELKIKTIADFMIGLPFERNEIDIKNNLNFLFNIKPDFVLIAILLLVPDTKIFRDAEKMGLTSLKKWQDFALNPSNAFFIDYWTEFFTREQLIAYRKKAYKSFYLRVSYILKQVFEIRSLSDVDNRIKAFLNFFRQT
jgi:anaerobic magnesium-protoporphyrin IX monomethyl ester cyclase